MPCHHTWTRLFWEWPTWWVHRARRSPSTPDPRRSCLSPAAASFSAPQSLLKTPLCPSSSRDAPTRLQWGLWTPCRWGWWRICPTPRSLWIDARTANTCGSMDRRDWPTPLRNALEWILLNGNGKRAKLKLMCLVIHVCTQLRLGCLWLCKFFLYYHRYFLDRNLFRSLRALDPIICSIFIYLC